MCPPTTYTLTPPYPAHYEAMLNLRKELRSATKPQLKEWITAVALDRNVLTMPQIVNVMKNGIYSLSNVQGQQIHDLLFALENVKKQAHASPSSAPVPALEQHSAAKHEQPQANHVHSKVHAPNASISCLSNETVSLICSYHDLQTLFTFGACSTRFDDISSDADSFHSQRLTIKYAPDLAHIVATNYLSHSLERFRKTKLISIDHFTKYNDGNRVLWRAVVDEIIAHFSHVQTLICSVDWVGIPCLADAIRTSSEDGEDSTSLKNLIFKHALQKPLKPKSKSKRGRPRTPSKQQRKSSASDVHHANEESRSEVWQRTKKNEVTEMSIEQAMNIARVIDAFGECGLNHVTFDMLDIPPTFEILDSLRRTNVECIAFNDVEELGFYDEDKLVLPAVRQPLRCQSIIIRDIDQQSFSEFFDPWHSVYFWSRNLKHLMLHWNITKRHYELHTNAFMEKIYKAQTSSSHLFVNENKRTSKKHNPLKKMNYALLVAETELQVLPDFSQIESLYVSLIQSNTIKSLLFFLEASMLENSDSLNVFVIRIPKFVTLTHRMLCNDFGGLCCAIRARHIRIELVRWEWMSICTALQMMCSCVEETPRDESDEEPAPQHHHWSTLQSLEIHVFDFDACNGFVKVRGDAERALMLSQDCEDAFLKVIDSLTATFMHVDCMSVFIDGPHRFRMQQSVLDAFQGNGFEKDVDNLWFVKQSDKNVARHVSHMDVYWEPIEMDL